jgi:hypothetical protein
VPKSDREGPKPPSLVPGVVLLALAAVLIVVVLVGNPDTMPAGLKTGIVIAAIAVIVALLGYAVYVFHATTKRGRK